MIEIRLPFPPSVNALYATNKKAARGKNRGRGRYRTKEYEAWLDQAGWELNAQRPPFFEPRCEIRIDLDESRNGDSNNYEKAVLDLLVKHHVIKDDQKKYVKRTSAGWEPVTGCRVTITEAA